MEYRIRSNVDDYDEQQVVFIGAILEEVKSRLEEAGMAGEQLREVTGNITFSIATLIDNSASIEFEGKEIFQLLTFMSNNDELIHCGGNSYTHEYVFGVLDEIFE